MDKTSLTLLDRLRNSKDELAWQTLADIYTPLLLHWIRRYEVQASDADDLVQEVLTVAARELPNFSHSGRTGAFRAWLRTTLVHRVRDFWRNRKRRPVATGDSNWFRQLDELEDPNSAISQLWQQQHDEHVLRHLLKSSQSRFAPTTWQAFRQVVFEGAKPADVAATLGITVNAVLIAKSRVLTYLKHEARGLTDTTVA